MNTIREIQQINQQELDRGIAGTAGSWHAKYASSAWVYVGNLDYELTEGDVVCVLSQFGEIEDLSLSRDPETGKSRGFAFVKYEDARSCVLAVDNLVGVEVCGRKIRVDHVENYKVPKEILEKGTAVDAGHAYEGQELENQFNLQEGQDLFVDPEMKARLERKAERQRIRDEREAKRQEKERRREEKEDRKRKKREGKDDDRKHKKKKRSRSPRDDSD